MVKLRNRVRNFPGFTRILTIVFLHSMVSSLAFSSDCAVPVYPQNIPVVYYGDIGCAHCDTVLDGTLPGLEEQYGVTFSPKAYDILNPAVQAEAQQRLEAMGLEYRTMPVLFIGENAYQGNYAIDRMLPEEVEYIAAKGCFRPFDRVASETRYQIANTDSARLSAPGDPGVIRYFWGVGCPYCERASAALEKLDRRYPHIRVERYEVFRTSEHRETFRETLSHYGISSTAVPQIFFEDNAWIGFSDATARGIEDAVQGAATRNETVLPFLGAVRPESVPAAAMTAALAFVDGFNPCSLWVLTMLLGMIAHTRSRRRVALVGGVFLAVTAGIYGLFMVGLLSVFGIAGNTMLLRILVAFIAVAMGLVNIKDYFFFKKGISFTIPVRFQRSITSASRTIALAASSVFGVAALTAVFAAGIAIVELPCTAGFPVIWSRYITATVTSPAVYWGLLGLYLVVYLLIEIVIVATALITLGWFRFGEAQVRPLKLLGGVIMISLGVYYVINPDIAATLTGVGYIFLTALAGFTLVVVADRTVAFLLKGRVDESIGITNPELQRREPDSLDT
jgi:glutaredoxin